MRSLFRKLFGVFMVLAAASMIAQGTSKHAEKIRELTKIANVEIAIKSAAQLKRAADIMRNVLLAKVDKPEPFCLAGEQFCLTFPKPELVTEVRDALKSLDIPDSLIEKILILGSTKHKTDYSRRTLFSKNCVGRTMSVNIGSSHVPFAILIDTEFLVEASSLSKKFQLLHEGGHVKAYYEGVNVDNGELNEVIADTYALATITRRLKEKDLQVLVRKLNKERLCPHPYLNAQELVYHAEKLRAAQQEGDSVNVIAYAQKIVADRKNKRNVKNWKKPPMVIAAVGAFIVGFSLARL